MSSLCTQCALYGHCVGSACLLWVSSVSAPCCVVLEGYFGSLEAAEALGAISLEQSQEMRA